MPDDAHAHGFDMFLTEEVCRAPDLAGSVVTSAGPFRDRGIKLT